MDAGEETRLRALYGTWPTARLAHAVAREQNEYSPEALALLAEELKRRNVADNELPALAASIPPAPKPRGTLWRPLSLNRTQYFVRWVIWVAALLAFGFLGATVFDSSDGYSYLVPALIGVVYKVLCMDIPRMKNAGLPPWLLLLMLVPVVNFFFLAVLFFAPPEK